EGVGTDQTLLRVPPANQSLEAAQLAIEAAGLGLVDDMELAGLQGLAQVRLGDTKRLAGRGRAGHGCRDACRWGGLPRRGCDLVGKQAPQGSRHEGLGEDPRDVQAML